MGSTTAVLAVALIGAAPAAAGTVLVTSGTGTGAGTLPYAVEHAAAGDEVVIEVPQVVLEAQVPINDDLTIRGQSAGSTQITATGGQTRLLEIGLMDTAARVTIEKLTLTGGHGVDGAPGEEEMTSPTPTPAGPGGYGQDGGAILNYANLELREVKASGNVAGLGGTGGQSHYGIYLPGGGGEGGSGGAIQNEGTLRVFDSEFDGNSASPGGGAGYTFQPGQLGAIGASGVGGAIANFGELEVAGSTFAENHAGGGAFGPSNGQLAGAGGAGGAGGAIYSAGPLKIVASAFSGNTSGAGGPGGGGFTTNGAGGNGGDGGAVYIGASTGMVTNSTFFGNATGAGGNGGFLGGIGGAGGNGGDGGAVAAGAGSLVLASSTLAANAARAAGQGGGGPGPGGGFQGAAGNGGGVAEAGSGSVAIRGSLLASNSGILSNCSGLSGGYDGGGNLAFPDAGGCEGFPVGDPKLDPAGPAANGGPTATIALQPGSAAIDADPAASCTDAAGAPLTVDQRGAPRPSGAACDSGAYELTMTGPAPAARKPQTRLTKKPKKVVKSRTRRAKISFAFSADIAGATFECKVDRAPFTSCRSPQRYRLKAGRHTFQVRAAAAGVSGGPVTWKFKVKRLKKKRHRH